MKTLIYPRGKRRTYGRARRVRNLSRFLRQKRVRSKARLCAFCPAITR